MKGLREKGKHPTIRNAPGRLAQTIMKREESPTRGLRVLRKYSEMGLVANQFGENLNERGPTKKPLALVSPLPASGARGAEAPAAASTFTSAPTPGRRTCRQSP